MEFFPAKKEMEVMVDWMLRIVYEESMVYDSGIAYLREIEYK